MRGSNRTDKWECPCFSPVAGISPCFALKIFKGSRHEAGIEESVGKKQVAKGNKRPSAR
jgi:hypothetical protein